LLEIWFPLKKCFFFFLWARVFSNKVTNHTFKALKFNTEETKESCKCNVKTLNKFLSLKFIYTISFIQKNCPHIKIRNFEKMAYKLLDDFIHWNHQAKLFFCFKTSTDILKLQRSLENSWPKFDVWIAVEKFHLNMPTNEN